MTSVHAEAVKNTKIAVENRKYKRAGLVIMKNDKVLVIRRIKEGKEYYVFPGGGVEIDEDITTTAVREAKEELNLDVELERELLRIEGSEREEVYFLVERYSGILELGGDEKLRMGKNNQYVFEWKDQVDFAKAEPFFPEEAKVEVLKLWK